MQEEVTIKTLDGHAIYGTLNKSKECTGLIIFVHGFTGNQNEHIFFNGSRYFTDKGFDTFRFDLYTYKEGARQLTETKISQHGQDIDKVIQYFNRSYNKIFVVGHSYGGTSLLFVKSREVTGFIFWDASYITPSEETVDMKYNSNLDAYILSEGNVYVIGKSFVDELKNFPDCGELVSSINKPVLFVTAGSAGNLKAGKKYFQKANEPKQLLNIPGADHCFNSFSSENKLFEATWDWISKQK